MTLDHYIKHVAMGNVPNGHVSDFFDAADAALKARANWVDAPRGYGKIAHPDKKPYHSFLVMSRQAEQLPAGMGYFVVRKPGYLAARDPDIYISVAAVSRDVLEELAGRAKDAISDVLLRYNFWDKSAGIVFGDTFAAFDR